MKHYLESDRGESSLYFALLTPFGSEDTKDALDAPTMPSTTGVPRVSQSCYYDTKLSKPNDEPAGLK